MGCILTDLLHTAGKDRSNSAEQYFPVRGGRGGGAGEGKMGGKMGSSMGCGGGRERNERNQSVIFVLVKGGAGGGEIPDGTNPPR